MFPRFVNVENELRNIEKHEYLTVQKSSQTTFQQVLLAYDGYIQIRQSLMTPLYGLRSRCIATAGLAIDLTKYTDPLRLLGIYKYYYPNKSEAVEKFLAYFNLAGYFHRMISFEELRTLLTMLKDARHKQVAAALAITPKTVASYLSSIRDKLRPSISIYEVLNVLRDQQRWKPEGLKFS